MRKLLLLLPLLVLAVVAWWMLGDPPAAESALRTGAEEVEPGRGAAALRAFGAEARAEVETESPAVEVEADGEPEPTAAAGAGALVVVTDADGQRVSGAEVGWELGDEAGSTRTDDEGRARLSITLPARRMQVRADRAGYATARISASGSGPFTLSLAPLTALAGRCLERDGRAPLAGVRLTVTHDGCDRCARDVATSGPDGRYALPEVAADTDLGIRAEGPGVGGQVLALRLGAEDGPHAHDLLLERGRLVRGSVVDFSSGVPLSGAQVSPVGESFAGVASDAAGRFELRMVPRRAAFRGGGEPAIVVQVEREGHGSLHANLTRSGTDLSAPVLLPLVRSARIEGTVRDTAGRPVPEAQVALLASSSFRLEMIGYVEGPASRPAAEDDEVVTPLDELPEGWTLERERHQPAISGPDGRYALAGLLPWQRDVELRISAVGFRQVNVDLARTPEPGGVLRRDFVLERAEAGAVVLGGFSVNGRSVHGRVLWRQGGASGSVMVIRSPYRIAGLRPGLAELEAQPFGFRLGAPQIPGLEGHVRTVEVPAEGELRADFEMRVVTAPIRGSVVDGSGAPVAGVQIVALLEGMLIERSLPSDAGGGFELLVPAEAGPYTLVTTQQNENEAVEGVAAGSEGVRIVLERSGELLLRVRDAHTGVALEPVVDWRRDESQRHRRAWRMGSPDPEGWRRLELPPGPVDVRIEDAAGDYVPQAATVRIAPAAPTHLEVDLERGLVVTLELDPPWPEDSRLFLVRDEVLARAPGALVWEQFSGSFAADPRLEIPPGPRAELRGIAPGTYRPVAWSGGTPLDVAWQPPVLELSVKTTELGLRWTRRP